MRPVTVERQQGMAPFRIIKVVSDVLETITLYVCSFLVFAMFLVVMVQVISRVLGSSVPWTEEISRYLLIWIGSLAASVALKRGSHAGMEFIVDKFHGKVRLYVNIIAAGAITVFLVYFTRYAWFAALRASAIKSTALEISMIWPRMAVPVGGFLMIISGIYLIFENINRLLQG